MKDYVGCYDNPAYGCMTIRSDGGKLKGESCPWCGGARVVHVRVWLISGEEVLRLGLKDNMILKTRSGAEFVVDPRLAPELGLKETIISLDCGHCDWHAGCLTIQDFAKFYRHFWTYAEEMDERIGKRCMEENEPAPERKVTFEEFIEEADVDEWTRGILESARRAR